MGQGRTFGVPAVDDMSKWITFPYTAAVVTTTLCCTGSEPRVLSAIRGIPTVVGSDLSAVTLTFYMASCASGSSTTLANGIQLSSTLYDLKGTVNIVQNLPLKYQGSAPPPNGILIPPNTAIGFVLTGTATAAVGMVQIVLEPVG